MMKNLQVYFISVLLLLITSTGVFSQQIEIRNPNGGDTLYANRNYEIKWTSSGVSSLWLNFTIDDGFSWSSIASAVSASDSTYIWKVPEAPTTRARIRISNVSSSVADTSDATFTIISTVGLQQTQNQSNLSVFPNPSNGKINIELDDFDPANQIAIKVFDALGKVLFQDKAVTSNSSVDIDLGNNITKSGIYFLQVTNGNAVYRQKVIIEK